MFPKGAGHHLQVGINLDVRNTKTRNSRLKVTAIKEMAKIWYWFCQNFCNIDVEREVSTVASTQASVNH